MRIAAVSTFMTVLVLATSLLLASSAGARPSEATLTIWPNAAPAWGVANASGCGYQVGADIWVDVFKPEAHAFFAVSAHSDGCISFQFNTDGPGSYLVQTRQRPHNHWVVLASYQLPVV